MTGGDGVRPPAPYLLVALSQRRHLTCAECAESLGAISPGRRVRLVARGWNAAPGSHQDWTERQVNPAAGRSAARRFYRLFFNAIADITLIPVLWSIALFRQEVFFLWEGVWLVPHYLLLACGILALVAGGRR